MQVPRLGFTDTSGAARRREAGDEDSAGSVHQQGTSTATPSKPTPPNATPSKLTTTLAANPSQPTPLTATPSQPASPPIGGVICGTEV